MKLRDRSAWGLLSVVAIAVAFVSCTDGSDSVGGGAGSAGEHQMEAAGRSNEAGDKSNGGATPGGAGGVSGGAGAGADAGQGGESGLPEDCRNPATVECSAVEAASSYDTTSCTLTLKVPAARTLRSASMGVSFQYANGDPEVYEDVDATVSGDVLTFDFSKFDCANITSLLGDPTILDACGHTVRLHASGFGFGPAIMVSVDPAEGSGGTGGAGGASNTATAPVNCGLTN